MAFAFWLSSCREAILASTNLLTQPQGAFDAHGEQALKEWRGSHDAQLIGDNNRFLRFSNDDSSKTKMIEASVKLEPTWKTLRFKTWMRATADNLTTWAGMARVSPGSSRTKIEAYIEYRRRAQSLRAQPLMDALTARPVEKG